MRSSGLAFGAAACAAWVSGAAAQATGPGQATALVLGDLAQARACAGWLAPLDIEVLRLTAEEMRAQATAAGQSVPAAAAAKPCADAAAKTRLQGMAQDQRIRLMMRAQALAALTDPVGYQLATTYGQKAALDAGVVGVRAAATRNGQGPQFEQLANGVRGQAQPIAGLTCASRATVRSPKGRPCPTIPAADQANVAPAAAMLASAEAFAIQYAAAVQQEQQQAAAAQKAKEAAAAAALAAANKAKTDALIAKTPNIGRFWKYDSFAAVNLALNGGTDALAECQETDWLLDLTDTRVLKATDKNGELYYAPLVKLDGKTAPEWHLFAKVTIGSDNQGKLMGLRRVDQADWTDKQIRETLAEPGSRPAMAEYFVSMRALAQSIDGVKPNYFRQCRAK